MPPISYARHQFPSVVIQHAVWLYLRFTLSYRDVEDLLAERGLDVSYESIRRRVLKFGPAIARHLRQRRPKPTARWHLDEMVVRIACEHLYLWRAVDDEGEVLDVLVQRRRDKAAAGKLMRKLLKKQGFAPAVITTDKLGSYRDGGGPEDSSDGGGSAPQRADAACAQRDSTRPRPRSAGTSARSTAMWRAWPTWTSCTPR
jgi:transposase-like protein